MRQLFAFLRKAATSKAGQNAMAFAKDGAVKLTEGAKSLGSKIWHNPFKSTVAGVGTAGAIETKSTIDTFKATPLGKFLFGEAGKEGGKLPWLLGAAAVGGLVLAFKDKLFGSNEEGQEQNAPATPVSTQAMSPEEQLMQAQMTMPTPVSAQGFSVGGNVTTAHPAAVGSAIPQVTQSAPATNWQAKVGGQKQPVPETRTPQESYAQTEQLRAEQAAAQQNGVV